METGGVQITGQVYHDRGKERREVSMGGMPQMNMGMELTLDGDPRFGLPAGHAGPEPKAAGRRPVRDAGGGATHANQSGNAQPTQMRTMIALVLVAFGALGGASGAWAQDLAGAKDHPMISRYPAAVIDRFAEEAFDEYTLLTGKVKGKTAASAVDLEGRVTKIRYWIAAGRSSLEVFRNYQEALTASGFETLYRCKNKTCGGRDFNLAAVPYTPEQGDAYKDQRYLAAHLTRSEGDVYVALYVNRAYGIGGVAKDRIYVQLTVVELQPMEQGLVTVDAAAMRDGLKQEGHIAIYGILFETDSANVNEVSRPALDEIATLLNTDSTLDLLVVGHTDDRGTLSYNLDLSRRRAQAVVELLELEYGITASRLEGHGVGYLAPVARNDNEAGRALNRRVELVRRRK